MKKYQPSNATDGDAFMSAWCYECKAMDGYFGDAISDLCAGKQPCPILGRSFSYSPKDKQYPSEWTFADDGTPICTAFAPKGTPEAPVRCTETLDMFGGK